MTVCILSFLFGVINGVDYFYKKPCCFVIAKK